MSKKIYIMCCGFCNEEFSCRSSLYHHFDIVHNLSQEFRRISDIEMTTKPMTTVSKDDHAIEIKDNDQIADLLEPLKLTVPTTHASQSIHSSAPKSTNFSQQPSTTGPTTPRFDPPPQQSRCNESIRNLVPNVTMPHEAILKRAQDDQLGFPMVSIPLSVIYVTQSINSCVPESTTNIAQSASTELATSEIKVEKQSETNEPTPLTVPSTSDSQSISSLVSESTTNIAQSTSTEIATSEIKVEEQSEKTGPRSSVTGPMSPVIVPASSVPESTNSIAQFACTEKAASEIRVDEKSLITDIAALPLTVSTNCPLQSVDSSVLRSTNNSDETTTTVIMSTSEFKVKEQAAIINVIPTARLTVPTYDSQSIHSSVPSTEIEIPQLVATYLRPMTELRSSQQPAHNKSTPNSIQTDVKLPNELFPKVTLHYRPPSTNVHRGTNRHPLRYRPYGTEISYNGYSQRSTNLYVPNHLSHLIHTGHIPLRLPHQLTDFGSGNVRTEFSINVSDPTRNNSMDHVPNETPPHEP